MLFTLPVPTVPPYHQAIMKLKTVRWEALICTDRYKCTQRNIRIKNQLPTPMQHNGYTGLLLPRLLSNITSPQARESKATK